MSEELLVNVTPHETRVAFVENGVLQEVHIERARKRGLVGNIYKGRVCRVWVIHGKGTGTLRRAVRDPLTRHKLVARCATAEAYRGGPGCTQVDLID